MTADRANILVVDDNRGMRVTLAADLEEQGYEVCALQAGKAALERIHDIPPDLVIADLRLPDISGLEILEAVKRVSPESVFILMTGYASLETAVRALNEGAFAYITKPFNLDEVHTVIGNALRQQRLVRENRRLVDSLQQSNKELAAEVGERRRTEETLQRLRRQNELILNSAGEGICGIDVEGNTTFVNPAAARMVMWEVGELLGKPQHTIVHHSDPDGAAYPLEECPILMALRDGEVRHVDNEVFWRKDGTSFPVEYICTPIRDEGGQILGAVVTFRDIAERLAVERMKDEFISVVSHELRTPLTSIRGSLGLIASGELGRLSEKSQRMADIAVRNTDRLVRLINDILDIERMESNRSPMERQACDPAQLIAQAADVMRALAVGAGVTLCVDEGPGQLPCDPDRIIQTLTNLLGNAIKFSPEGSTVRLSSRHQGNLMLFQVKDEGRGIPADKLESIFERFQQADVSDAREKGGSGLGLVICRSIVQQHGGRIWAESTLGKGSTFSFTFRP